MNFDGFLARVLSASNPEKEECGEIKEEICFMGSEQEEITEAMEEEYEKTVKSAVKARKKADRLAQKPQFSDPSYFGHKKPPIRRPPGKQKYCKECELRH